MTAIRIGRRVTACLGATAQQVVGEGDVVGGRGVAAAGQAVEIVVSVAGDCDRAGRGRTDSGVVRRTTVKSPPNRGASLISLEYPRNQFVQQLPAL